MDYFEESELALEFTENPLTNPYAMLSAITNLVCPQCGGSMMEFRCRSKCRKDWRSEWQRAMELTRQYQHSDHREKLTA